MSVPSKSSVKIMRPICLPSVSKLPEEKNKKPSKTIIETRKTSRKISIIAKIAIGNIVMAITAIATIAAETSSKITRSKTTISNAARTKGRSTAILTETTPSKKGTRTASTTITAMAIAPITATKATEATRDSA